MHIVPFTIKRAHLVGHRLLQRFAAQAELTPARFDLMLVLKRSCLSVPFESEIARWLGVSRPTVCKMVRRMREAGMLEISVDPEDRRRRRISITAFGKRCYAKLDKMRHRGKIAAAVRAVWRAARLSRDEVRLRMYEIIECVGRYCRGLDDHISMFGRNHLRGYGFD